jgi:hypothetical protein
MTARTISHKARVSKQMGKYRSSSNTSSTLMTVDRTHRGGICTGLQFVFLKNELNSTDKADALIDVSQYYPNKDSHSATQKRVFCYPVDADGQKSHWL